MRPTSRRVSISAHTHHCHCRPVTRNTHTLIQVFIRFRQVENCTLQLDKPHNFPQRRNTTLLHKFHLTSMQILEYTPTQRLPARLPHGLVYANDGARIWLLFWIYIIGHLDIHL